MNFREEYKKGQEGLNFGLSTGIKALDLAINGIQRKSMYGIAGSPKAGKSSLVDYSFLIQPYLYLLENPDIDIEWIYFSFEIDRVRKEFKIASYFLFHDYKIYNVRLPTGVTHKGMSSITLSPNYLMGKLRDDKGRLIKVDKEIEEKLMLVYQNRIIPLFGEYDNKGNKIRNGKIIFVEETTNPTGLMAYLMAYAEKHGKFVHENYEVVENNVRKVKKRVTGYLPNNPKKYTIVITDHLRKLKIERGFTKKDNIDKYLEYSVLLRNWCGFTFVHIIHLNRNLGSVDRLRFNSDFIYPTGDDVKDTG